jgi:predicted RNase H-like HicB family nuclease
VARTSRAISRTAPISGKLRPKLQVKIEGIQVEVDTDHRNKAFVTYVPELNNISTFGETLEDAMEHTRDMILTYIVSMDDDGLQLPYSKAEIKRLRRTLRTPILKPSRQSPKQAVFH